MNHSLRHIARKRPILLRVAATGWLLALGGVTLETRASAGAGSPAVRADVALPSTGPIVPELAALEQAMTGFMNTKGFEAGTIALMKDSKLVFRQGYGWRDTAKTAITHPDNLFRLASISKTITGCAITKLVGEGKLSKSTKVYAFLGILPWGGVLGDARINNITVQQLLDHTGGWDRDISPVGDPVFSTVAISLAMGLDHPATASEVIAWMLSKPLDFTPGARSAYSNFGYSLLGRVVEKASGKSYLQYLQQDLLGSVGVTAIIQSRSRPSERDPWEIWYADSAIGRSAVDFPTNISVRAVDGGLYYESFDSFGGLTASAGALCGYMRNYWVGGDRRVATAPYRWIYTFYGSLPGTTTVIHQDITQNGTSATGLEFTVLFNERTNSSGDDNDQIHTAIVNAAAAVTSWPAAGGGAIQWSADATEVSAPAGSATVQLVRSGTTTLPVKVSYATYDRTATGADYSPTAGTVSFAAGETSKTIAIPLLASTPGAAAKEFLVELISAAGGAWLDSRVSTTVRILNPVVISSHPQSQTVTAGANVTFTVAASGNPSPTFQWQESANGGGTWTNLTNTSPYSGATTGTLTITGAPAGLTGFQYRCVATNAAGATNSSAATLTVGSGAHLVNLSSRASVGTGDNVLIVGFVITGSAPKPVIIRGIGPTLAAAPFGMAGTLPDPVFDLYHAGAVVAHNDNWATAGNPATVTADMARVGAFSLGASSLDSVISTTLNPGVYSAILSGNGAVKTGVGMVEIYDASLTLDATTPRLVNISSRGFVGTGDNVLIGGFVVTGDQPRQVLIRGVGPTLTSLGVTGTVLADPIIYLYHSGTVINQNDNWGSAGDGAALSAAATAVGAFALPSGSTDAALLTALQPGVYSVIVAGVGNTTGIALVEIYEVGN